MTREEAWDRYEAATARASAAYDAACATCAHAAEHGWYGPEHRGAHCGRCHRSWTAAGQAHCTTCCEHFANYGTANLHWGSGKSKAAPAYDARHVDPADVPLLAQAADGVWHRAGKRPGELPGACGESPKGAPGRQVPGESRTPAPRHPRAVAQS